jgi:hypothetical protein
MNEVHQAKSSLNKKLHKPANHYYPVCKVFKPVGWAKTSLARSGSTSKGGRTGEIGIGGAVARSPLPHHRTCGSASGGSDGLS